MGENTKIQWCDCTGSPWIGCTEVSPGCAHCYARQLAEKRLARIFRDAYRKAGYSNWETMPVWGDKAPRVLTKGFWDDALWFNRRAEKSGVRLRMFPSQNDWLDDCPAGIIDQDGNRLDSIEVLVRFLKLIHDTPNLDWLLLTKRPENWRERIRKALAWMMAHIHVGSGDSHIIKSVPRYECAQEVLSKTPEECKRFVAEWIDTIEMVSGWVCSDFEDDEDVPPANVWIGTTVENQKRLDERKKHLLAIPAARRFFSVEPMLEHIEFTASAFFAPDQYEPTGEFRTNPHTGKRQIGLRLKQSEKPKVDWVIFGGESGPGARPCNVEWIRYGVQQCKAAGIPVFVKQLGAFPVMDETAWRSPGWTRLLNARLDRKAPEGCVAIKLNDPKGGDINEWPEDLRIREFPEVVR